MWWNKKLRRVKEGGEGVVVTGGLMYDGYVRGLCAFKEGTLEWGGREGQGREIEGRRGWRIKGDGWEGVAGVV